MPQATPVAAAEGTGETSILVYQVAGRQFAVELALVQQIIDYQPPTRTPRRPPHIEGVIEYKGCYLPVANLRKRFGLTEAGSTHPAILLLAGVGRDPVVGVVVDQVQRVMPLPPEGMLPPPPRVFGIRAEYIRGVANAGGRPVVWLDMERLLTATEPVTLLA
jgi:purine-binding chemotaxis protein CheW